MSDPIIRKNVVCPVCGGYETHYRLKTHLFVEQGRDIDLRPLKILRKGEGLEGYFPVLYYIWYCDKCHFASSYSLYENPNKVINIEKETFKKKIIDTYNKNTKFKNVINKLSTGINKDDPDFFQALKLHLLAIYNLLLFDKIVNKESIILGKYSLRLAWLFHDILNNDKFRSLYERDIKSLINEIKNDWPSVPENEELALKNAVNYYYTSLIKSVEIETPIDEVNIALLIARIHLKLMQINEARVFIERSKEISLQLNEEKKLLMENEKENTTQISKIASDIIKIRRMTQEVQNIYEDVRVDHKSKQMKDAKKLIQQNKSKKPFELHELLIQNNIEKSIIQKLVPLKRKKGFLGMFRD